VKILSFSTRYLIAMFILLAACSGGGMAESELAETEIAESQPASNTTMLGGGTSTEVHPGMGGSPRVKVDWVLSDANISIAYGRPYLKGRTVGESVEPLIDKVWRIGADEATTLMTDKDVMFGEAHIPAGEYTLWTMNMNDEFHLIINSETGQWGTAYDANHDVAHVAMDVSQLDPPAEQLVLSLDENTFSINWGQMTASVKIMIH